MALLAQITQPLIRYADTVDNDLPWRGDADPYHVWISEIMLQQTRIAAVLPYYDRFLCAFPTVQSLAEASDDKVMKLWEGLGYYSRARNLKKAAVCILNEYGGVLPRDPALLRRLPGIGAYTAGAIASIAYGVPEPAVDGNVLRVIMRLFACSDDVLKDSTKCDVADALRAVYPSGREATLLTEGLMLLGERVCTVGTDVRCDICPLRTLCRAHLGQIVPLFPVRSRKKPRRVEEHTVLLLRVRDTYAVRRRPTTGLLAGLYEYPHVPGILSPDEVMSYVTSLGLTALSVRPCGSAKHIFTHVEWHMTGYEVLLSDACSPFAMYNAREIRETLAIPSAFRAFTEQLT